MRYYEKLLYLGIGGVVLAILFWHTLFVLSLPPAGATVITQWTVVDPSGRSYAYREGGTLSKVLPEGVPPGIFTYTAKVEPFIWQRGKKYALVISHPSFHAFEVYIDGILVGSVGDMESGKSSIWNSVFYFPIDEKFIYDDRLVITIRGYSTYIQGFDVNPFIVSLPQAVRYVSLNTIVSIRLLDFAIGGNIVIGLSILALIFFSGSTPAKKYLYFALASLSSILFYLDYTPILHLFVPYFLYKKILVIFAFFSLYFVHRGVVCVACGDDVKCKRNGIVMSYLVLVVVGIVTFFGWDMATFRRIYTYSYIIVPITFIYDLGVLSLRYIRDRGQDSEITILLLGMIVNVVLVSIDIYQLIRELMLNTYAVLVSVYGFSIFILAINFALLADYVRLYRRVESQEKTVSVLKDVSMKDPLTGAYNRKYLEDMILGFSGQVCFLMLDIDHFKDVNDTYGHEVGDKVLKHVVSVIMMQVRSDDVVIRYGGEEFLIVLRDTSLSTGRLVGERIRKAIADSMVIISGQEIRITVSIGVCCGYVSDSASEEKIWSFINKADEFLYLAKRTGRNKVVAGECPATG